MKKLLISFALVCVFLLGSVGVASAHALPHPHHRGPGFGFGYGYPGYVPAATTSTALTSALCQLVLSFLEARSTQTQQEAAADGITQLLVNCINGTVTTAPVVPSSPFSYGYCPFCYRGRR